MRDIINSTVPNPTDFFLTLPHVMATTNAGMINDKTWQIRKKICWCFFGSPWPWCFQSTFGDFWYWYKIQFWPRNAIIGFANHIQNFPIYTHFSNGRAMRLTCGQELSWNIDIMSCDWKQNIYECRHVWTYMKIQIIMTCDCDKINLLIINFNRN